MPWIDLNSHYKAPKCKKYNTLLKGFTGYWWKVMLFSSNQHFFLRVLVWCNTKFDILHIISKVSFSFLQISVPLWQIELLWYELFTRPIEILECKLQANNLATSLYQMTETRHLIHQNIFPVKFSWQSVTGPWPNDLYSAFTMFTYLSYLLPMCILHISNSTAEQ